MRNNGSSFHPIDPRLAAMSTEELEAEASRLFQLLDQVQSVLELRYDELPVNSK